MNDKNDSEESKTTSEKPVSLSPLSLKEALEGLLKVGSKEDEEQEKTNKDSN